MVKEFYANAVSEGEELKCWVRGKCFSVTLVYLAEILRINWLIFTNPLVYGELNPVEEVLREVLGVNLEFSSNRKFVSVASLSPKLRLLTMIMFSNLYPLSSIGYMNLSRALFLHDLIIDEEIDVCSHIFHILAKTLNGLFQGIVFLSSAISQGFWSLKACIPWKMSTHTQSQVQLTSALSMQVWVTPRRVLRKKVMLLREVQALPPMFMMNS